VQVGGLIAGGGQAFLIFKAAPWQQNLADIWPYWWGITVSARHGLVPRAVCRMAAPAGRVASGRFRGGWAAVPQMPGRRRDLAYGRVGY